MKKAGVMGWPIDHSLSPRVHGYWLEKYHIEGEYTRIPVEPDDFPDFLRALKANGFVGGNVTVPHKEAALATVDEASPEAKRLGAVNTIVVRDDGSLYGFNTDGFGFLANLKAGHKTFNAEHGPAVVLGAGGAARAIVASLLQDGCPQVRLVNRTIGRAQDLAADLGGPIEVFAMENVADSLAGASLLVNTTSLGMVHQPPLEIDLSPLPPSALVTDIVYAPLITNLLVQARERGNPIVDGLGMLLHQARPGFRAWFGVVDTADGLPEVDEVLRASVLAGLKK